MTQNETKQRLIKLIAEHQFSQPGGKLAIGLLSKQAGITRQSFHRYYDDLKPYARGLKPIAELLGATADDETSELLQQSHTTLLDLNKKLALQERQFEAEKAKILASYVTSLMNDDITKFNTDELRQTFERTIIHNEKLSREVENLKIEIIKEKQKTLISGEPKNLAVGDKVIINPDFSKAFESYSKTDDEDKYDSDKQNELDSALMKIIRLCQTTDATVVIFAERYLSNFEKFANTYQPSSSQLHIILRLPIFNRALFPAFLKKIAAFKILVYIPFCDNQSIRNAQRAFHFRQIPTDELKAADSAHAIAVGGNIDMVCTFRVRQGD